MSISAIASAKPVIPYQTQNFHPFSQCNQVSENNFQQLFHWAGSKIIATDEVAFADLQSVVSFEIGDCITIFGIETKNDEVTKISGYHFAQLTDEKEMLEEYFDAFSKDTPPSFFVIGGNASTTKGEGTILQTMYTTIENYFGSKECIKGKLLNLTENTQYRYVTAGLNLKGELYYYLHS